MEVIPVPVLDDNLSYIIVDKSSGLVAVVDPAQPEKVVKQCHRLGLSAPVQVWTTHKHLDHSAGNSFFAKQSSNVEIIGGADDNVPYATRHVRDHEVIHLGKIKVTVLAVPCHTRGHVLYYAELGDDRCLFTGDTLFIGGCGRFFEGNAHEMNHNLNEVIASLPGDTKVYCGHEYTIANLEFARKVEPENRDITEKLGWAMKCRQEGNNTVPSTIAEELRYNPFMRMKCEAVQAFTGDLRDDTLTMERLRELKNRG